MITNESELKDALRRLAASTPQEAPAGVERKLIGQFRGRRLRKWLAWSPAIAAVAVAAGIAAIVFAIPPLPEPPKPVIAHAAPPTIAQAASVVAQAPKQRPRARATRAAEVATTFYALSDADSLTPSEDTTVVRVRLPRSAMLMVGLPVNEERINEHIQADVVLGQDGLMRAVRFLQ